MKIRAGCMEQDVLPVDEVSWAYGVFAIRHYVPFGGVASDFYRQGPARMTKGLTAAGDAGG